MSAAFTQQLSNALRHVVRQGEPTRVLKWELTGEEIHGSFLSGDRQLHDFKVSRTGFSSKINKTRSDAFAEGIVLHLAGSTAVIRGVEYATSTVMRLDRRECSGKTSQPCGDTCINDQLECRVNSAEARQVAGKLLSDAKALKVGAHVGGSVRPPRNEAAIAKRLKLLEPEILNHEDFEEVVGLDREGNVVSRIKGDQHSVPITMDDARRMKNGIMTHNHPSWNYPPGDPRLEGRSFSLPDLHAATTIDLDEIRAVAPGNTYSLKRGEKGWGNYAFKIQPTYTKHAVAVHKELTQKIRKGEVSAERAEQAFQGMIVERVAKDMGWTYTVTPRKITPTDKAKAKKRNDRYGVPQIPSHKETAQYSQAQTTATALGVVMTGIYSGAVAASLYAALSAEPEALSSATPSKDNGKKR